MAHYLKGVISKYRPDYSLGSQIQLKFMAPEQMSLYFPASHEELIRIPHLQEN